MTKEEFQKRLDEQEDWAPGWDAIEEEFSRVYPDAVPEHYATNMVARAIFGGDEYLDGYSIYSSPKGYYHLVTFGMTELYADPDRLGKEWNKWGYEMTIKLKENTPQDCIWAINMIGNLARYTYKTERFFEAYQYVSGNNTSLHIGEESLITALITVPDTEVNTLDTIYGRTEFIQLVGITEQELQVIKEDPSKAEELVKLMKQDNPDLVTDMKRTKSYL